MRKLTKEQKRDIRTIAKKRTKTLISLMLLRFLTGVEPKWVSSIGKRRNQ